MNIKTVGLGLSLLIAGCNHSGTYVVRNGEKFLPKAQREIMTNKLSEIDTNLVAKPVSNDLRYAFSDKIVFIRNNYSATGIKAGVNKKGNGVLIATEQGLTRPTRNAYEFDKSGNQIKAEVVDGKNASTVYSLGKEPTIAVSRENGVAKTIQVDEKSVFDAKTGNQIFN